MKKKRERLHFEETRSLLEVANFGTRLLDFLVIVTLRKALKNIIEIAKVMIEAMFHMPSHE